MSKKGKSGGYRLIYIASKQHKDYFNYYLPKSEDIVAAEIQQILTEFEQNNKKRSKWRITSLYTTILLEIVQFCLRRHRVAY